MPEPANFDFASTFADAQKIATENESHSGELLWGHVISRAAHDENFRKNLASDPEQTVAREAETLKIPVSQDQLKAAKAFFSRAVPGIDRDKVETLIFNTIEDVRKSFNMTLQLSQLLFFVGIVLLVASAIFTWVKGPIQGSIFGGAGIISLVTSLVRNPLDRIRNAGANLVQVQMAYLAYYNLLYLLGSRGDELPFADTQKYAHEMRESATSMVQAVQGILRLDPTEPTPPIPIEHSEKATRRRPRVAHEKKPDVAPAPGA
jgi:hypothetical protein